MVLVCNPRAGGGLAGARLAAIVEEARRYFATVDVRVTQVPGHACDLARQADASGCDLVVAVGGDGTVSEVVDGLLGADGSREAGCALGVIAAGTGSDFARTLGMPHAVADSVGVLHDGQERRADVMTLALRGADGVPTRRVAANVVGFGLNGAVVRGVGRSRLLSPAATYAAATARAFVSYRAAPVRVVWESADGTEGAWSGSLLAAFVANGRFCGGGIDLGAEVRLDDGLVDLLLVPKASPMATARGLRALYQGQRADAEGVIRAAVRRVEAVVPRAWDVWTDCDGEPGGTLPLTVQVVPGRLRVRGAWRRPAPSG